MDASLRRNTSVCSRPRLVALVFAVLLAGAVNGERPEHYEWVAAYASARAKVAEQFDYHPSLLCGRASVHGHMTKHPPQRLLHQLSEEEIQTHQAHRLPTQPNDVWYISHEHRFIYLRGHKAGSTTITKTLQDMFCGGQKPEVCRKPKVLYRARYNDSIKENATMLADYFVYAFVRNPFTRLASGYRHFSRRLRETKMKRGGSMVATTMSCPPVEFSTFARDTRTFWKLCEETGCCPGIDPLARRPNLLDGETVDMHFNAQSSNAFNIDGTPVVDFIGRLENFEEDWAEVWATLERRNNRTYTLPESGQHENVAGGPTKPRRWYRRSASETYASPPLIASGSVHVNGCGEDEYEDLYNVKTAFEIALQYSLDFIRLGFPFNPRDVQPLEEQPAPQQR